MMLRESLRQALHDLRRIVRPALVAYLALAGLASLAITPLTTWLLATLLEATHGAAITRHDALLDFALQPVGVLWFGVAGGSVVLVAYLQLACVIELARHPAPPPVAGAVSALARVARRLPPLLGVLGATLLAHVLLLAGALVLLQGLARALLAEGRLDALAATPAPAYWAFAALAAGIVLAGAAVALHVLRRWSLAPALVLNDDLRTGPALRRSRALSGQLPWRLRLGLVASTVGVVAVPAATTGGVGLLTPVFIGALPSSPQMLSAAAVTCVALTLLLALLSGLLAVCLHGLNLVHARRQLPGPQGPAPLRTRHPGLTLGLEAGVIAVVMVQAVAVVQGFEVPQPARVTAHRGASEAAPENTLPAIREAVRAGADLVEVDVRQTADGALVLVHDAGLLRTAGVPMTVADTTLEALRRLDVGRWFHPRFAGEPVPTLGDAIEAVRGRAGLYVDIKPNPLTPGLTRDVVDALRAAGFIEHAVIASAYPAVLAEARRRAPGVTTALLAQWLLGPLDRSGFDALGLRHNRIDADVLAAARRHRHELHAWTVNRERDMRRLLVLGVDNIITDRPARLVSLRERHAALGPGDWLGLQLANWLRR